MKAAILVMSDPKSGSEEALGRVFNALATTYDFKQSGDEVSILFHGTGTRWISELSRPDNPVHGLFELVKDKILGVSSGCADVFGATADLKESSFNAISENQVPGTSGLPSLRALMADGYSILTF
ncbi:hypothetical protein MNBD_GAMMA13-118 [hydrothermal vent metagenome]|uniref:Uncharacterized protein n=1 Tax=hydrothermal vent metagenome TaxID=652676 RepID=A0A3B0YP07_9ZZZZ